MATLSKIISSINSSAEFSLDGNNLNDIVWLNGTTPISVADIEAKKLELENQEQIEKTNKETKKASGKQKLIDLGLTEEEVKALIGV